MLNEFEKFELKQAVPTSFTLQHPTKGEVNLSASVRYANQFILEDQDNIYPVITLQYSPGSMKDFTPIDEVRKRGYEPCEKHFYDGSSNIININITKITDIVRVIYYDGGVQKVWEGDPSGAIVVKGDDAIEFVSIFPDVDSWFEVHYKIDRYLETRGGQYRDILIVEVSTKDVSTPQGNISGIIVSNLIAEELKQYFEYIFRSQSMVTNNPSEIRNLDTLTNVEGLRKRQFTIQVHHTVRQYVSDFDIRTIDETVEVRTI